MNQTPSALAVVSRGHGLESTHYGHIAVVDTDGSLLLQMGDPQTGVFLRSAAKPFQAMPLYEDNVQGNFGFSDKEMALICASHNGEDFHVAAAASMLRKIGLSSVHFQCGVHRPLGVDLGVVAEDQRQYTVLHNNCSGKHTGMLAACRGHGWPVENYLSPDHPHQRRILAKISAFSGLAPEKIGIAVDGCSAPVFHLPLRHIATMYARLATDDALASRSYALMWRNAEMVAGSRRFDTAVMAALDGKIVAKIGAEGLECLAVRYPRPLGIAVKIVDGNNRAVPPVVLKLLDFLGVTTGSEREALQEYESPKIYNHRKIHVGDIRCDLRFAAFRN